MLHAVIMAGGSGTRFWPESRASRPKQLLPVTGGEALLVEAADRLKPQVSAEQIWVVTNAAQIVAYSCIIGCYPLERLTG